MATKTLSNWTKISYNKNTGTFNVNWKTYSNKSDAASAINSAKGTSSWSSWWSSSSRRSNTSFVDPSVLHDQHMGKSNTEIASKWGGPDATVTSPGWQKVLQALAKSNKVYWTGWYQQYNHSTGLYEKPSAELNKANSTAWNMADPASQYSEASYKNYTNAFNKFKWQWMDDATARSQAAKLLEKEDLLSKNNDEKIAEMSSDNTDDFDAESVLNWVDLEWEQTEPENPDMNDQVVPEWRETEEWRDKYISDAVDSALAPYLDRLEQSNVIKETVPEERDTTFDFNTYYNSNVADQTPYEGWQTKDVQQEGLTFAERYEEPITNSLQDLGLLTPNEQAAETMPNTEEQPAQPEAYNSAEDIVDEFNTVLTTNPDEQQPMTTMDALRKYQEYKRKLEKFVNDNKLSEEEYNAYLNKIRNNAALQQVLKDNWAQ